MRHKEKLFLTQETDHTNGLNLINTNSFKILAMNNECTDCYATTHALMRNNLILLK